MRLCLILVSLFVAGAFAQDACTAAAENCDFEFYEMPGEVPTFDFTETDVPYTPQVVHKNPNITIGILNSNGVKQEFIDEDGTVLPIIDFGKPPFTPEYFKPYAIPKIMGSAVGVQVPHGNQKATTAGKCVKVYFTHFQRMRPLRKGPPHVVNVVVKPRTPKCVVFKVAA